MHPEIAAMTARQRGGLETAADLDRYYSSVSVVATTALGIAHPVFEKRRFDYSIIDEASQIALPVCLGPLKHADKFVLIGDPYQLPPLFAQSDTESEAKSLFKLLSEAHPHAVSKFTFQYRMNKDIQTLANHLVYDYRLQCGSLELAYSRLGNEYAPWFTASHSETGNMDPEACWLAAVLNPANSVLFLNTDAVPSGRETKFGNNIENNLEARMIYKVTILLNLGRASALCVWPFAK
jgi:DNA replication ATP-dependent helicase Dna2